MPRCTDCHGNAGLVAVAGADVNVRAAPPTDSRGNTATFAVGVGVHQAHVNGSRSRPVACAACHAGAVPTTVQHPDGVATVAFGGLGTNGGVAPTYATGSGGSCAATYCHGNFVGGVGTSPTPAWTAAGTLGRTSCHGNPPTLPHPQDLNCADCHGAGYSTTTVSAATHVDGTVNLLPPVTGCTACHGDATRVVVAGADANARAAPPAGSRGERETTTRAVGAHAAHLFHVPLHPRRLCGVPRGPAGGRQDPRKRHGRDHLRGHGAERRRRAHVERHVAHPQLLAPWNASPGNQTMTCSDCHNSDAASSAAQGPHGSAVTFMLSGTNKAWPYTVAGATSGTLFRVATSELGVNTANGLFCRNCHPQVNSSGSNSLHRNGDITSGQHGSNASVASCTGCHLRIPHGGKVSRLLVTTNAPARYRVGAANFAQITKPATKDGYSTSGFPAGFKSACSQHSSGTWNEAW